MYENPGGATSPLPPAADAYAYCRYIWHNHAIKSVQVNRLTNFKLDFITTVKINRKFSKRLKRIIKSLTTSYKHHKTIIKQENTKGVQIAAL